MSLMRVCQPSPVARSAARTSGSSRSFTGSLLTAATLPAGRPRRRATTCSGVCTRPARPSLASARASRNPGSACHASASMAAATFSTLSFFKSRMLSAPFDVLGFDVRAFSFDHSAHDLIVLRCWPCSAPTQPPCGCAGTSAWPSRTYRLACRRRYRRSWWHCRWRWGTRIW
jgi:hypothetical protein